MEEKRILAERFVHDYMNQLFYFSLKKTGNVHEAENLSQDIALAVLTELERGIVPEHFPGYVWQIARNRYARWAKGRHREAQYLSNEEMREELSDGEDSPESALIHGEELSFLRRELAFVSSDYRDIMVAYYIRDNSIRVIAGKLGVSENAVKTRLFRARNLLKEGMNMAREFGKRSYMPENVNFTMSGYCGERGEPYSLIGDLLSKNILLSAYDEPQTAEEIAMETGVALPYVEDILAKLVNGTLMIHAGNKYATAFYILSAEVQRKQAKMPQAFIRQLTDRIIQSIELQKKFHDANGSVWHEGYQTYDDMKWALLMFETDDFCTRADCTTFYLKEEDMSAVQNGFTDNYTSRPNGGCWELLGHEMVEDDGGLPDFVGMHGCESNDKQDYDNPESPKFWQYKFCWHGIADKTPVCLSMMEGRTLKKIAQGDVNQLDPVSLKRLESYGYIRKNNDAYVPTFWVKNKARVKPFTPEQQEVLDRIAGEGVAMLEEMYRCLADTIITDAPKHLLSVPRAVNFAISSVLSDIRGAVLEEALKQEYISYRDGEHEAVERMLGAYIAI